MIRMKDGEPRECAGKYLINQTNLGLQIIVANQSKKSKKEFINDFTEKVAFMLEHALEER